jgi:hypothetical protein
MVPLAYKIATEASEFEAIHRLNYDTFVEEIPQHGANPERRLVDRFHAQNTYVICLDGPRMAGMVQSVCGPGWLAHRRVSTHVPDTGSSGPSLALTCWERKFERVRRTSVKLRAALREHGLPPLAAETDAAPGITTVPLPGDVSAKDVATELAKDGFHIAHQSEYLRRRNWLQICLMGEFDETVVGRLPGVLAAQVAKSSVASR